MINVIPQPKKVTEKGGRVFPGKIVQSDGFDAAAVFDGYRQRAGVSVGETPVECRRDASLAPGAYRIVCEEAIVLRAADEAGMNHAFATLLQLCAASPDGGFDAVDVEDAPDFEYRGMMIDNARIFHSTELMMRYVDLCWFYKYSYLHVHFTDTESYTLPCDTFPKLPTPGRHYTKDEIALLCAYAKQRGVKIMPEIDVPGHCSPFIHTYPEIFVSGDYPYIIGFTKRAFDAFEKIFGELCEMFPDSDRIHVGGDEAAIGKWLGSAECREYAAECGIPVDDDERLSAERILAVFIRKLSDFVLANGRTPVCWEGFAKEVNYLVPRTTEVFSWEILYQVTPDLMAGGYRIINGSWRPNYVVWPDESRYWSVREMFEWSPRRFQALSRRSPYFEEPYIMPKYGNLIGGQMLSWGDHGSIAEDKAAHLCGEFAAVSERAPATAEGAWNGEKTVSYEQFESARLALSPLAARLSLSQCGDDAGV